MWPAAQFQRIPKIPAYFLVASGPSPAERSSHAGGGPRRAVSVNCSLTRRLARRRSVGRSMAIHRSTQRWDVVWVSADCSEWLALNDSLAAIAVSSACVKTGSAEDDISLSKQASLLIVDDVRNNACAPWGSPTDSSATRLVYYRSRSNASFPNYCGTLSSGCKGYVHSMQHHARRCSVHGSPTKRLRHVYLNVSGSGGNQRAAEQIHALLPADLLRVETWVKSGSCHGNEPVVCLNNSVNVSLGLSWQAQGQCYFFNTVRDLAAARVAHISATVRASCRQGLASCPFATSTWGNINPALLSKRATLVNETMVPHHESCSVVGSGPTARGHGAAIDARDAVIRFNDAPLHPHYDVGTRTTYRVTPCTSFGPGAKQHPLCASNATRDPRWPGHMIWKGVSADGIGHDRSYWQLRHRWVLCNNDPRFCSTGMWGIAFALTVCQKIHLYGYGPARHGSRFSYARYYRTPSYEAEMDSGHHYFLELAKIYALHCAGYLTVHGPSP